MKAWIEDPKFLDEDSVLVEILESGDSLKIGSRDSFAIQLPVDTLWSLCLSDSKHSRCFEVSYSGPDTTFRFGITADSVQVLFTDTLQTTPEPLAGTPGSPATNGGQEGGVDSLDQSTQDLLDSLDQPQTAVQQRTRLEKVVLQLRRRPRRELGKSVISTKRIKRLPSLAEADVIRTIQSLPGVVASSDFSTKIYVRGGGSDQNLFLLDNAVVYSPVHFFGLFSTFLVEGLDGVQFYKGGFNPEYGNRLSSVVDLNSRNGGTDTTDTWFKGSSLKISTFATQAHTEGKQGDFRWLVAGRATYLKTVLDGLERAGLTDFTLDYGFYDLQGNVLYTPNNNHSFRFSWYWGRDELNFSPFVIDWGNTVLPFNWLWTINDDWYNELTVAYSAFDQKTSLSDLLGFGNGIYTQTIKEKIGYKGFQNQTIEGGIEYRRTQTEFTQDFAAAGGSQTDDATFHLISPFVQYQWQPGSWDIKPGLRLNYQTLAEHFSSEPRLSLGYAINRDNKINFHVGQYYQYINSIIFGDQESVNEFYYPSRQGNFRQIPPARSWLFSLGYNRDRLLGDWNFNAETYYKTLNDLLVWAPDEMQEVNGASTALLADLFKRGEGYSLGYELSIRKDEGIYTAGVSWAQGLSVFLEEFDTAAYYPDWHQPRSLKADGSIAWRGEEGIWQYKDPEDKEKYFRSSIQLAWNKGLPFTEIKGYHNTYDIMQSPQDGPGGPAPQFENGLAVRQGARNGAFRPDYFRLDIKPVDIGREGKWNFSWTILNVTNRENVFLTFYDESTTPPEATVITQFPFFPILLNYEYYF